VWVFAKTPPGTYSAECSTESNPTGIKTTFFLTAQAESTTTTSQQPALNGHWTGTFTYASVKGQYLGESYFKTLHVPLPMTLDITLDAQGQGTALLWIDASGIGVPSQPSTVPVPASLVGDTLTLTMPQGKQSGNQVMRGQVSSDGKHIKGTWTQTESEDPTFLYTAEWQVTR
jgi:hypothetical protein